MIDQIIDATREAGRLIEAFQRSGVTAEQKGAAGPVTEADRRADALLKERLLGALPAGWLSEETADDAKRLSEERLWVVDPLDGTKEFLKKIPEYSVAVALVERGKPILGVVHNPATEDTYWAELGGGAFYNGEPIHVTEGATMLASRSEVARGEFEPFQADWDVKAVGSIQLKLALVASGTAGVTLSRGPKHEWDVCAGAIIIKEAGGMATDVFGDPLLFNRPFPKTKGILAGAPKAFACAKDIVDAIGASDRMSEFDDTFIR